MTVLYQLRPTLLEPVKVDKVISSEKGKDLLVITGFRIRFQKKILLRIWKDGSVVIKNAYAV
jgi:hypothetical protein